ncbi:MAG: 50S ribosomal protein L5 [Patescibacteria group bacterium]
MNSLQKQYKEEIAKKLMADLGIKNVMAVPKLVKIVINVGLGEALKDKKVVEKVSQQLAVITGQKPQPRKATKAISTFKLRAGDVIGVRVTLRATRMYDFFQRLTMVALPRVRDFRGVPNKAFDNSGNYTLGLSEQIIFPELEYGMIDKIRGFEVTFVTTAKTNDHAKALLTALGMPFAKI